MLIQIVCTAALHVYEVTSEVFWVPVSYQSHLRFVQGQGKLAAGQP